jgi:hypothetical protein
MKALIKKRTKSVLAAKRPSAAVKASYSGTISASEGKLFMLTIGFVSAIARLSSEVTWLPGIW